jgi:curved DNA-binding protein CbpA
MSEVAKDSVCKIIKNDGNASKIINTLRIITGFDICGKFFNLYRGNCYINQPTTTPINTTTQEGGGLFSSCLNCITSQDIIEPSPNSNSNSNKTQKSGFLQLFYRNNGITLKDFLKQNSAEKGLNFYILRLLNIAKGINVLQKNNYVHGYINLNNILITETCFVHNQMLLINLDDAEKDMNEYNKIDVSLFGEVIKDILKVYPIVTNADRHNTLHKKLQVLANKMYRNTIEISEVIDELKDLEDEEIDFDVKGYYSNYEENTNTKTNSKGQEKDYYEILEITRKSTQAEIRKRYYILARKYHPDKNLGVPYDDRKIKQLNDAYEILGDVNKRKKYDENPNSQGGRLSRKSSKQPVGKQSKQPATKQTKQPVTKPTKQPAKQPKQPATKQPKQPVTKPTKQPAKQPATKQAKQQATKQPATKQAKQPATKQAKQPATKQPKQPATKQAKQPATKQPKQPATKQPKQPATKQAKQPATKQPKQPATKQPKQPATKQAKQPVPKSSKTVTKTI